MKTAYSNYRHAIECALTAHEKWCGVYRDCVYKVYWSDSDFTGVFNEGTDCFIEGTCRQLGYMYEVIKGLYEREIPYDIHKETVEGEGRVVVTFTDKKTGRVAICPDADKLCVYIGEMQVDWLVHLGECGMCR